MLDEEEGTFKEFPRSLPESLVQRTGGYHLSPQAAVPSSVCSVPVFVMCRVPCSPQIHSMESPFYYVAGFRSLGKLFSFVPTI